MADSTDTKNGPTLPIDPRLQADLLDLMDTSVNRARRQEPVHQAALAMAMHMAPSYAQTASGNFDGTDASLKPRTDPNTLKNLLSTTGTGSSGGPSGTTTLLSSLLSALAMSGGGGDISKLIQQLINLFRHGGRDTTQGDKPYSGGALNMSPQDLADLTRFMGWDPNTYSQGGELFTGPPTPTPHVTTGSTYSFPNDILNNPSLMHDLFNGMPNDPSGGTGVGPGMQSYYGMNTAGENPDEE